MNDHAWWMDWMLREVHEQQASGPDGKLDWTPNPGPQTDAYNSDVDLLLFGGCSGGGKSALLLAKARTQHRSSLLLRRSFPELERSLIRDSKRMFANAEHQAYNDAKHVWRFGDGRMIEFGHLERDDDVFRYHSAEYDFIGYDEGIQFSSHQFHYLLSRLRTTFTDQRCQAVIATNPGPGWCKALFSPWLNLDVRAGEERTRKRVAGDQWEDCPEDDPDALRLTYLPARLTDNPYIDPDYRRRLNLLPEPYRSQLLLGDWEAGSADADYQVIPTAWVVAAMRRWREWRNRGGARPERMTACGVDIAYGGGDMSVIAPRFGVIVPSLQVLDVRNTMELVGRVKILVDGLGGDAVIEAVTMGVGVYDRCRELGLSVVPFVPQAPTDRMDATGVLRFADTRSAAWWHMREWLDPENAYGVILPSDDGLLTDLAAPRWSTMSDGRVRVEKKVDIKKRIGRSTDRGDAVVMAFWVVDEPGARDEEEERESWMRSTLVDSERQLMGRVPGRDPMRRR